MKEYKLKLDLPRLLFGLMVLIDGICIFGYMVSPARGLLVFPAISLMGLGIAHTVQGIGESGPYYGDRGDRNE